MTKAKYVWVAALDGAVHRPGGRQRPRGGGLDQGCLVLDVRHHPHRNVLGPDGYRHDGRP